MHQRIVVDRVEEFRQVHIHGRAVPFPDVLLHLPDSIVGQSTRPESKTRFRETRIKDRDHYLADGLLNQPVQYRWDTQWTGSPVRFGYLNPEDRQRLIGPIKQ